MNTLQFNNYIVLMMLIYLTTYTYKYIWKYIFGRYIKIIDTYTVIPIKIIWRLIILDSKRSDKYIDFIMMYF